MKIEVGIDFDNTVVCYDSVFAQVASEEGLIPDELPATKSAVRDYLRSTGREDTWTELQGVVYGTRMRDARPFPGVCEFFVHCRERNVRTRIISHKTKIPYRGIAHDLHEAARDWLYSQGFFDRGRIGMSEDDVHFELTRELKLERIGSSECSHFVDDLPEFLESAGFPSSVQRILFDPGEQYEAVAGVRHEVSWNGIMAYIDEVQDA